MAEYLLGLDEGTTGCKACVFDLDGNVIASDYREYPCYYPQKGWVEQIPEDITPALYASVKAAVEASGVDPADIKAMGISSQGSVIGLLDEDGKLIRPFVGWQDLRGEETLAQLGEKLDKDTYYKITGNPLGSTWSYSKLEWLRENEPENWAKTALFSTNQDYFLRAFGAEDYWTDLSSASREGTLITDTFDWDPVTHDILGIPIEKRAKIALEPGKVVGHITAEVAAQTGLAEGTALCVAAHDQNCSTFGGGAVNPGETVMVIGTFGSCFVVLGEPNRDPAGKLVVKPNHGVGNWTIEAFSLTSASAFRWYRDTLADMERSVAAESGRDPYDVITESVAQVPPGANGVTFLPYLQGAAGSRQNGKAQATFIGMSLGTTKADMARAVLEGICFEMREIVEAQKQAGIEVTSIRLTGGAAKSPLWCQMLADIFQCPIDLLQTSETGCLGAALYSGIGIGLYPDAQAAVKRAVKVTKRYEPKPENAAAYDAAFARFVAVYEALEPTIFV
ncbi:FGGY-family carbohydrate kinase [Propionicicella superfundia]|uniref:FGGY-family carbohydrate kinase n=1 Tax=Propionicicella superfundia TaxID=348582 RepID=UPI0004073D34|nr:FGGY family carbohydrate kinase [Propionicicella superfundia]